MSSLFNEAEADAIVEGNIAKYKLHLAMVKELDIMRLFKDDEGQVYEVVSFESVHREDLVAAVKEAAENLELAEKHLKQYDDLAPAEPTPAPVDATPAVPEAAPQPTPASTPNPVGVTQSPVGESAPDAGGQPTPVPPIQ